uniref:Uncharacterized protein n=1 Tax=Candidatus Kentrum sp. LFY TaxID=2126342 RepID=A0A450W9N2_9GAMM|nr:MAG: hypothetical protein BECKLFY1418C_GA0070996_100435 [Candidatus Kentron sp. LFY]
MNKGRFPCTARIRLSKTYSVKYNAPRQLERWIDFWASEAERAMICSFPVQFHDWIGSYKAPISLYRYRVMRCRLEHKPRQVNQDGLSPVWNSI